MTRSWLRQSFSRGGLALALGTAAMAAAVIFAVAGRTPPISRLEITAGFGGTTRELIAKDLARHLTARGIEAEVVPTGDTASELSLVDSGAVQLGLVSQAYRAAGHPHVREVAPLHLEALHLLVKSELLAQVGETLAGLRGLRVDVGPVGSTTAGLAAAVLEFTGRAATDPERRPELEAHHFELAELRALLERGDRDRLPDAVFHLATLPSEVAFMLVRQADYRLLPLPFGEALRLSAILRDDERLRGDEASVDPAAASELTIPPFTYGTDPPIPAEPTPTIGSRLLLVAHEDVPAETIERVIEVVFDSRFARYAHPPLERASLAQAPSLHRHPGTLKYLARNEPFLNSSDIADLSNTLQVLGGLLGGGVFLWQGFRQQRQARQDLLFAAHMLRVAAIERRIVDLEISTQLDLEALIGLQREIRQLKSESLERFVSGELGGQRMLFDLIAPVDAARDHVANLLLHVRENLEQQAQSEGRSVDAVWEQAAEAPEARRSKD